MKNKNLKNKIKELYESNSKKESYTPDIFLARNEINDKFSEFDLSEPYKFIETYFGMKNIPDLCNTQCFLYHGIRFQNHLEKLESIFEKKAINFFYSLGYILNVI